MKEMLWYIWLKDSFGDKMRVMIVVGLLVGVKVFNVQVFFFFKEIVDFFNMDFGIIGGIVMVVVGVMILVYGGVRIGVVVL